MHEGVSASPQRPLSTTNYSWKTKIALMINCMMLTLHLQHKIRFSTTIQAQQQQPKRGTLVPMLCYAMLKSCPETTYIFFIILPCTIHKLGQPPHKTRVHQGKPPALAHFPTLGPLDGSTLGTLRSAQRLARLSCPLAYIMQVWGLVIRPRYLAAGLPSHQHGCCKLLCPPS